jgi:TfoX/Sxy family transcriptional regulator of competence genes
MSTHSKRTVRRHARTKDFGAQPVDPTILAVRVERCLPAGFATTKQMFGGLTFLYRGNMLCCVSRKGLMVRVGAEAEREALASPFASRCLGAGRPMAGFIMIEPTGIKSDRDIARWLAMARSFVEALPPKTPRASRALKI